jgi:hypothetical protein
MRMTSSSRFPALLELFTAISKMNTSLAYGLNRISHGVFRGGEEVLLLDRHLTERLHSLGLRWMRQSNGHRGIPQVILVSNWKTFKSSSMVKIHSEQ